MQCVVSVIAGRQFSLGMGHDFPDRSLARLFAATEFQRVFYRIADGLTRGCCGIHLFVGGFWCRPLGFSNFSLDLPDVGNDFTVDVLRKL